MNQEQFMNQNPQRLPEDRRKAITELRKVINKNLPLGFVEGISYGSISWSVPHSSYPPGYHCDSSKPLMLMCLSSTKGHVSLHHMGLYASGPLLDWFRSEWPKYSPKKLDMGKACVRFRKPQDIPLPLIGELASKMTPGQWVETYENILKQRATSKVQRPSKSIKP